MTSKKKILGYLGILLLITGGMSSCSDTQDTETVTYTWTTDSGLKACDHILFTNGKEDVNGTDIGNGDQEFVFTGYQVLSKKTYNLKGWIYVADSAVLAIDPGTIIKADKDSHAAIIVEQGGKIIAQGNDSLPIVFTSNQEKGSRKPGDWGGIILCGKAPNNQGTIQLKGGPRSKHGGSKSTDNSGTLSYVRIEYAGYPNQTSNDFNGLTLASVGSGTTLDHIQISYSNDDSYEWLGGCANAKHIVSYHTWDDDFDTNNGYYGKVQFGLAVRDSKIADSSLSNSIESDNCEDGSASSPYTAAEFSNMTLIGPKADSNFGNTTSYINGDGIAPSNSSSLGKYQAAIDIRRSSQLSCYNSIAVGYPVGLILDNQVGNTQSAATNGKLKVRNCFFANMDITGSDADNSFNDFLVTGYDSNSQPVYDKTQNSFSTSYFQTQLGNKVYSSADDLLLTNGYYPASNSPTLSVNAFSSLALSNWFTEVSYIGAFSGSNDSWLQGWTNFDPQNTDY